MIKDYPDVYKRQVQSTELNSLIKGSWYETSTKFGTKESTLENYDIYFEEGIKVRTIQGRIFNIVFTERYSSNIVNDIKVTETQEKIIQKLGEPNYQYQNDSNDTNMIGYKGKDFYIFFSNHEVSVYRVETIRQDQEFVQLLSLIHILELSF